MFLYALFFFIEHLRVSVCMGGTYIFDIFDKYTAIFSQNLESSDYFKLPDRRLQDEAMALQRDCLRWGCDIEVAKVSG